MELRTLTFTSPSRYTFVIREQNGEDEDILSNQLDAANLMNITKFISAIVVKTDFTTSGKLTVKDALNLPLLDRYAILFQSRIFSIGEELEFTYRWGDQEKGQDCTYVEDLRNYLFKDYSVEITEEEIEEKPQAIPVYPLEQKELSAKVFTLSSGKNISFELLTGNSEQYMLKAADSKKTRNLELLARNLKLEVDGHMERVSNFKLFSVRDMAEMRKLCKAYDPSFSATTEIENPNKSSEKLDFPILGTPAFFFLTEA